jgi:hypothetical protein
VRAAFALGLICSTSLAQSAGTTADRVIQNLLDGQLKRQFTGKTPMGEACALYLSDKGEGVYFIVVGLRHENDLEHLDDYIGVVNKTSRAELCSAFMSFKSNESWGNESSRNAVDVQLQNGLPVQATGVSDLKSLICSLGSLTIY